LSGAPVGAAHPPRPALIRTIGHSDRSLEEFLHLLRVYEVTMVVDVRKMPRSRRNPQFNRETLAPALQAAGIEYREMPGLGGLRRPRADSPNKGWKNSSFQGYADYMLTSEFEASLQAMLEQVGTHAAVLMCAEAVPWRCHRSLIADALVVRGIAVEHILSPSRAQPHHLHPWARVEGTRITYPSTASPSPSENADQGEGHATGTFSPGT
jgi:uncharacterized protein (DUF488 family)